LGHACSTITLMNLIRMGNTKILERYECDYLRDAAIAVTKITTGREPAPMKPIYGERALDVSFDFGGIAGGQRWSMDAGDDMTEEALAAFFQADAPMRISTLSSERMIVQRLINLFGENHLFNEDVAAEMKRNMIKDLEENRKEEYMSEPGIAMLFDRSGGKLTEAMAEKIAISKSNNVHSELLLKEVRKIWDEWDIQECEGDQRDDHLTFESFYNGFMAPYFGCHSCEDTRKGLQAIDMDKDGKVDWNEFMVYVKWALNQYPDIGDVDELLAITFKKGLIPAMKDEVLGRRVSKRKTRRQKNPRRSILNRKGFGNSLTVLPE